MKRKYQIVFEETFHEKLKKYANEAEVTLGDAIGILCQHAEARVDHARMTDSLPYAHEWKHTPDGKFNSMLYHSLLFTGRDQAEIYKLEDEKGLPGTARPFFPFYGKST